MEKQTLGEEKIGACAWCEQPFAKRRFDQRFCSPPCLWKSKNAEKSQWATRSDREKQNARRKAYYQANRERELQKNREYRLANLDATRQKDREEYQRNKAAHMERSKAYRAAHPDKRNVEYRNARKRRPWKAALANARNRSAKKKLEFDLTLEWCEQNWTGFCAVTKLPFEFGTQTHFPFAVSIDRIDSSLGYLQTNCRFVLFAVNSFKGIGTDAQMLAIAQAIVDQNRAPETP